MGEPMCNIPISATIAVENGKAVVKKAEYRQIPAALVAEYLINAFGRTEIYGIPFSGAENCEKVWKMAIFGEAKEKAALVPETPKQPTKK